MTEQSTSTTPGWPRYLLALAALAACGVSRYGISRAGLGEWSIYGWTLIAFAFVAAWALGSPPGLGVVDAAWSIPERTSRRRLILGWAAIVVGLGGATAGAAALSNGWDRNFEIGFGSILAGTTLWSIGLGCVDQRLRRPIPKLAWPAAETVAFLAVVLLGLFLRFYRYGYFPPPDGVCAVEEPQSGQGAMMIIHGMRPWEFMLDRWMPVIGMTLLGHSFTAIRIPFTVVSWITIIPLYFLLRELVSRPAALFATLMFAFCRWHLIYARHAHAVFGPTLPIILTILALSVRVYKRGGLAAYPWIGLLSGYTLYAYAGYRATSAFVGVFFVISLLHLISTWRRAATEEVRASARRALAVQVGGYVIALIGFALVVVPLVSRLLLLDPHYFYEAAIRATDDDVYYSADAGRRWALRAARIRETAMMFNHLGDGSPTFNEPGTPQLDPISGVLFVVGLAFCVIWGWRRFQGYFAFYFLVLLAFGTVFVHNYDVRRLQGIIPLIFILVGFVADRFGQVTLDRLGRKGRAVLVGLAAVVLGGAFYDNYRVYFTVMMNNPTVRQSFHNQYTIGIAMYHSLPDNAYLYLVSDMANFFQPSDFEWVRGDRVAGQQSNDLTPLLRGEHGPWTGRDLYIAFQEPFYEGEELSKLLRERFPAVSCAPFEHPDRHPYASFRLCHVGFDQREGRAYHGGIRARYFRAQEKVPFLEREEKVISFGTLPDPCKVPKSEGKPFCRAEWEGTWEVESEGDYTVIGDIRRGDLQITIDDTVLQVPGREAQTNDQTLQAVVHLTAGAHRVVVRAKFSNQEFVGARIRVRRGDGGPLELMRFGQFDA